MNHFYLNNELHVKATYQSNYSMQMISVLDILIVLTHIVNDCYLPSLSANNSDHGPFYNGKFLA